MSEAAVHVRELAERIGPRPATTDTEAQAADYIQGRFEARGQGEAKIAATCNDHLLKMHPLIPEQPIQEWFCVLRTEHQVHVISFVQRSFTPGDLQFAVPDQPNEPDPLEPWL